MLSIKKKYSIILMLSISEKVFVRIRVFLHFFLKEEFEDTKGVIRIRKSKDRQYNGQKKKNKRTSNDIQNIAHKTKDRVTRIQLKTGVYLRCSGRISSSYSTSGTQRVTLVTNPVISHM